MGKINQIKKDLNNLKNPSQKAILQRFFKTGPGEYAEGDVFLGLKVPHTRAVAKNYYDLPLNEISILLNDKIHEYRLAALVIICEKFRKGNDIEKKEIFNFYLKNTKNINNWDLVDLSVTRIVGEYLLDKDRKILYKLAKSKNLWERRIAIVSTLAFIRKGDHADTLLLSEMLLNDPHDLIHKACGWALREVGKKDQKVLESFLNKFSTKMPRTMLRYSIEKFPNNIRKRYLKK